jgi:hypothetical protein
VIAFRLWKASGLVSSTLLWAVVGVRVIISIVRAGYGPNEPVQLYLDRVVWATIFLIPFSNGDWFGVLIAVGLCTAWYLVSSIGSNAYARAHTGWEAEPQ